MPEGIDVEMSDWGEEDLDDFESNREEELEFLEEEFSDWRESDLEVMVLNAERANELLQNYNNHERFNEAEALAVQAIEVPAQDPNIATLTELSDSLSELNQNINTLTRAITEASTETGRMTQMWRYFNGFVGIAAGFATIAATVLAIFLEKEKAERARRENSTLASDGDVLAGTISNFFNSNKMFWEHFKRSVEGERYTLEEQFLYLNFTIKFSPAVSTAWIWPEDAFLTLVNEAVDALNTNQSSVYSLPLNWEYKKRPLPRNVSCIILRAAIARVKIQRKSA